MNLTEEKKKLIDKYKNKETFTKKEEEEILLIMMIEYLRKQ